MSKEDQPKQSPFWKTKSMDEMSTSEWESLCDGCARCCLQKIEFEDVKELHYTAVSCQYLDTEKCQCTQYTKRHELVPDCVKVSPDMLRDDSSWLPTTCAYRLISDGEDIPDWHPLKTGRLDSVHEAGISVRGKSISELGVPDEVLDEYIIDWVKA